MEKAYEEEQDKWYVKAHGLFMWRSGFVGVERLFLKH